MIEILHWGIVKEDGKLHINKRSEFDNSLLRFIGKDVEIIVRKKKKLRSTQANRYYWAGVLDTVRGRLVELGHDVSKQDCHEFLKGRFHYKELIDEKSGECIKITQSTAGMTPIEFSEYIDKIKQFAAEVLDIQIPDANEQLEIHA